MNHFDPNRLSNGRREIASHHYPLIGPYDGNDAAVLEYHLLTMKLAHIDGVIVDWYGLSDYRDYPTLHRTTQALVRQAQQFGMQVAICYEDQTVKARETAGLLEPGELVDVARSEIQWLDKHWFNQSHYVKVNDSPVLLSFGHAGLSKGQWSECLAPFDGRLTYFSQDYRRDAAVGGFAWPNPATGVNSLAKFVEESQQWRSSIPCAFPRFQDIYKEATVSEGYDRIPDEDGETFAATWRIALDAEAPIIQLVTWNDWGEGTQIEPSQEFGYRDLELVQRTLNRWTTHERQFKPEDLRLPHRLYLAESED